MHWRCSVAKQIDTTEPRCEAVGHICCLRFFAGPAREHRVKLQELSAMERKINFRFKIKIPIMG